MKLKKILASILALCMVLSTMGTVVFAEDYVAYIDDTGYESIDAAIGAAQSGDTVIIKAGTYAVPSMKAGITIEGEGNVILEGTLSGTLKDLTLKNIHIKGANAQRWAYASGELVFENVTFEATSVYALHFDGITEGTKLLYKDCTIIGWAAMGGSPASCVFDGCTIRDNGTYGVIRTYFDAEIKDCTFDVDGANPNDIYQDGIHAVDGAKVKVNDCINANGDIKDILNISTKAYIFVDDEIALAPDPEGNDFTGYTNETSIWGEVWGNAIKSFEIKILDADDNVMGTTSLNNIDGIIDGDVNVTWNIKLDANSNTDEYWTMNWTTAPSLTNVPAKVELWVDGVLVSDGNVVLNAPDSVAPVFAAKTDDNGNIISYIRRAHNEDASKVLASSIENGDNVAILVPGTYSVPTGKDITITGAVDGVKFDMSKAVGVNASMTFNNVTFEYGNKNYVGLQHAGDMVYNNCTINGQVFLYGESETFNNCTFNQTSKDAYNVWTYGAKDVDFNGCTINSAGKAVLVYSEDKDLVTNITLTDSKLNASEEVEGKAAIEIDSSLSVNGNYTIEVNNTTVAGFGTGNMSGQSMWNNKKVGGGTVVVVDDEIVYAYVAGGAEEAVAVVNGVAYATLQGAVDATNGNGTVTLVGDVEESVTVNGPAVATYSTEGVVIDLDGYTLNGNVLVANNATVEVKNGTIVNNNKDVSAIETVGTTTLTDLNVTSARHAVRVEGGITTINRGNYSVPGTTKMTTHVLNVSDGGKAIVNDSIFTGPAGTVSDSGSAVKVQANSTVEINGGKYVGGKLKTLSVDGTLAITTGTFDQDPTAYVVDTNKYNVVEGAGMWAVVDDNVVADKVYVQYRKTDVKPGTKTDNLEGSDTYEIVLSGNKEKINELASADLTFKFTSDSVTDGAMTYTVAPAAGVTLSQMGHRYMFNYNGKDLHQESGEEIVIGTITIEGYGKYTLKTDDVGTNAVYATKIIDNIVDGYRPAANLIIDTDLDLNDKLINEKFENVTIKVPTRKLKINITFPNAVEYKAADYQQMTVTIVGGNVNETIKLDEKATSYTIAKDLPYNTAYTVTVEGAGYRTARYTVKLTENKTLNFWNNVMSNAKEIEVGEELSATTTTFLAGDIVKDNNINIYDLSAVVSYFGTENLVAEHPDYAKYDLNRDGVIDSKDVAYVLVSWGN